MLKKVFNLQEKYIYIIFTIFVVAFIYIFYGMVKTGYNIDEYLFNSENLNVHNVIDHNNTEIDNFYSQWVSCTDDCKKIMPLGNIQRITITDSAGTVHSYNHSNLYSNSNLESMVGNKPSFYNIKKTIDDHNILSYFLISDITSLPLYSIYEGEMLVSGSPDFDALKISNSSLRVSGFKISDYKLWIIILSLIIIIIVPVLIRNSLNKKNEKLEVQILDQTMSLTEANKELENERDVFSGGPVIIIKWSSGWQWDVSYVSPNSVSIIGYSYSDFMSDMHYDQIIHSEDIQRIRDDIDTAIKQNKTMVHHREFRVLTKSGEYLWVDSNTKLVQSSDGNIQLLSYLVDINDKMDAFRGLRNQRLALDQATILSSSDLEGKITYTNDRFCDLCGHNREDLMGSSYDIINNKEEHDNDFYINLRTVISRGEIWSGEICYKNKKNQTYWVNTTIIPSMTESGLIFEYQSIGFEITEAKNHQLQYMKQKAIADKANEAKSQFLANMSHELRTPMNGLMGMATLLQSTTLSEQQFRFVEGILSSADHQLSILNNILDLSKMQSGKMDLEHLEFNLLDLINDVITLFSPTANKKGIELGLVFSNDVVLRYNGDKSRLKQVLTNLINNAIKFTHWGRITIRLFNSDIHDGLRIEVEDTGVGIPKKALSKLFKKFSQVDETITRKFGGTGLGLSICKYIIEAHNGSIGALSTEGIGSTFWIEIPIEKVGSEFPPLIDPLKNIVMVGNMTQAMDIYREIFNMHSISYSIIPDIADIFKKEFDQKIDVLISICSNDKKEIKKSITALNSDISIQSKSVLSIDLSTNPDDISSDSIRTMIRPATSWGVLTSIEDVLLNRPITRQKIQQKNITDEILTRDTVALVVDDNKANRDVLQMFVNHLGGKSDVARDGLECLEMIEKFKYDIIFMDCHMPGMDGFSTIKNIKDSGVETPIVMLTADITKETEVKAKEVGANGFMLKPIDMSELRDTFFKFTHTIDLPLIEQKQEDSDNNNQMGIENNESLNMSSLEMMMDLDPESTLEIINDILNGFDEFKSETTQVLDTKDYEKLERAIHKFKGGALSFANTQILDVFGNLNQYLQETEDFDHDHIIKTTLAALKLSEKYVHELSVFKTSNN